MKKVIFNIFKNIVLFIFSMFLIISITFFLLEKVPGKVYDFDYIKNENVINNIENKYGYNDPVHIRYFKALINFIKMDYGNSYIQTDFTVKDIIIKGFKVSSTIGSCALVVSFFVGIILGYLLFKFRKEKKYKIIKSLIIIISSIPTFVVATMLQYFLCVKLKIFNVYGLSNYNDIILPILILSISPIIFISRILEKKLTDISSEDYIIFAKSNGLDKKKIILFYYIKNSITPILSYMAPLIANLLVGSFVVESIFNIPGLGRYFINSIFDRDYPLIMGLTVFFAYILIGITYLFNIIITIINYRGDILDEKTT